MSDVSKRNRQSGGQPSGGQFATEARGTDTGVALGVGTGTPPPEPGYEAFDDVLTAGNRARDLAADGYWTVMEHVHTYREDEVHDGMKNDETSTDAYEVQVFDTEEELIEYTQKNGYTQVPHLGHDDEYDLLETEPYSDPYEPTVEERTLMVPHCEPAVGDEARERVDNAYVEAAAWLATEEDGDQGDMDLDDIDADTREQMLEDLDDFVANNNPLLTRLRADHPDYPIENIGHDFYLSRNGHGAGFFDRGLGDVGTELQDKARAYGPQSITTSGEIIDG